MGNNKHRVKAFTIMELTIAMLISAVVIGITYTSYNIVSQSYLAFKKKNEETAIFDRVDQLLKRDIGQAAYIGKTENGVVIQKLNRAPVTYQFDPNYIVRISGRIDTFKVVTDLVKTAFEGNQQSGSGESLSVEENRIDGLSFTANIRGESIPCRYDKTYSSANLIQRNPDAIN